MFCFCCRVTSIVIATTKPQSVHRMPSTHHDTTHGMQVMIRAMVHWSTGHWFHVGLLVAGCWRHGYILATWLLVAGYRVIGYLAIRLLLVTGSQKESVSYCLRNDKLRKQVLPEFIMISQKRAWSRKISIKTALGLLTESTNGAFWRIIATTSAPTEYIGIIRSSVITAPMHRICLRHLVPNHQ